MQPAGIVVLSLACTCSCAWAVLDHGAAANPTGDPIGGGTGYTRTVAASGPRTTVVDDLASLLAALANATSGSVVYVDDSAEIRVPYGGPGKSTNLLTLKPGVTLASGRGRPLGTGEVSAGAKLYYTDTAPAGSSLLLVAAGAQSRVTGLRVVGPDPEVGDHGYGLDNVSDREAGPEGVLCSGVGVYAGGVEVDNCELSGFSNGAVSVGPGGSRARVHHNSIAFCRRTGMGYCVVVGSATPGRPADVLIEANTFEACRHAVASSGFPYSSYEARYNQQLPRTESSVFDRHGTVDPGTWVGGDAGNYTIVHHNTVMAVGAWAVGVRGVPVSPRGLQVYRNWFAEPDASEAVWWWQPAGVDTSATRVVEDNVFGPRAPCGTPRATLVAATSPARARGRAPLVVSFDASASTCDAGPLHSFAWDFGDGERANGPRATHNFTQPGRYLVELRARDRLGITAQLFVPVVVMPPPGAGPYVLSLWIKDSYRGARTGFYSKRVSVGGTELWRDDCAGDEGWQHLVLDATQALRGKSEAVVAVDAVAGNAVTSPSSQIVDVDVLFDDVVLFGAVAGQEDFEGGSTSFQFATEKSNWTQRLWCGDSRSGTYSYWISNGYSLMSAAHSVGSATLSTELNPTSVLGSWRQDEMAGQYVDDASPWDRGCMVSPPTMARVQGAKGMAVAFDGSGGIVCDDAEGIASSTGTVQFWLRPTELHESELVEMQGQQGSGSRLSIGLTAAGGLSVEVATTAGTLVSVQTPAGVVAANRFAFVAIVQSGTAVSVLVDGVAVSLSGKNAGAWLSSVKPARALIGGSSFTGVIDEVAVATTVLSAEEALRLTGELRDLGSWPLDEASGPVSADTSGNNHTLAINTTGAQWVSGTSGSALRFGGSTASAADSAGALAPAGDFSVELWAKFDSFGAYEYLLANGAWQVFHRGEWASRVVYFLVSLPRINRTAAAPARGDSAWDGYAGVKSGVLVEAGRWYHIVAARSGTSLLMYVNGKLTRVSNCLAGQATVVASPKPLVFGKFRGALDGVFVRNRAMGPSEVRAGLQLHAPAEDGSESAGRALASMTTETAACCSAARTSASVWGTR
eukprot:m51a1_g13698 hypothetical protein (1085) ;mRNA; f:36369-40403